jgi:hypothetical protein
MRLLLDSHVPHAVAPPLRDDGFDVETLADWRGGRLLDWPDDTILEAAATEARTLVSFDCKSIPRLLRAWGRAGRSHGGVILIDEKTIRQNDIGGIVRALRALLLQYGNEPWTDRSQYLRPA